jgi:formate dehydrogenase major subunit
VNICHIKRAAADFRGQGGGPQAHRFSSNGKRVAIVGSGPAGLAAAGDLATLGFEVTMLEALNRPGGMLRYGIPEFRLPRTVLDQEIEDILGLGVTLKSGTRLGSDVDMETLQRQYEAVLLAAGCYESIPLGVEGENLPGLVLGLEFMMDVCAGRSTSPGQKVLVIGAGFTAFDCARSALRQGAEEVDICLRRTEEDLAVTQDEVEEAKREGIKIQSLMLSRRVMGKNRVEGVEFVRTRAGEIGTDDKRNISPIAGSEFVVPADTVIVATGQRSQPLEVPGEKNDRGVVVADPKTFQTSGSRFYVAGDFLTGPSTVIQAVAMGRRAAERIAEDLTGQTFRAWTVRMEDAHVTDRKRTWDYLPRQDMPTLEPVETRFTRGNLEVETGFTREQAVEESKRCYLCYLHYEIDISRCIYCRYCIDVAPRDCIKMVREIQTNDVGAVTGFVETTQWRDVHAIVIDNSRCIRCGECLRVCPVDCISVTRVEKVELLKGEEPHG